MDEKVRVVLELDKECFSSLCFMLDEKLTDEMWQKLTASDVVLQDEFIGSDAKQMKLAFAALAIGHLGLDPKSEQE